MSPSLTVQRLDRATNLASSTGLPIKCLVFPATGGLQAIDAAGAVLDLVGATGALTATVTDTATNSASTALSLVHALSAGVGANGIGVTQRFVLPNSLGVAASAGQITVSYTDATSGSEDSALGLALQVGGVGTAVLAITSPTAGAPLLTAAGATNASLSLNGAGTGGVNLRNAANTVTVLGAQNVSSTFFGLAMENAAANTTGGAQTINAVSGRFRILAGAGAAPIDITNNRVLDANSIVIPTIRSIDGTLTRVTCIAAAGKFTVTANANATDNVDIDFVVINRAV